MEELPPSQRRRFTGRSCNIHPDPITSHAIGLALHRAEKALASGCLLSPTEAMALALHEARDKDTLFSLARKISCETGGNQEDILCRLGERFPEYA